MSEFKADGRGSGAPIDTSSEILKKYRHEMGDDVDGEAWIGGIGKMRGCHPR